MPESISLEKPLVIIGDEDVVVGFQALGFKAYTLKEPQEFRAVLDEIVNQKAAVCLVQDNLYRGQEDQLNSYKNLPLPIFIPFTKDAKNALLESIIKDIRLRATGTGELKL